jgi:microcystin-dependent protein
LPLENATFIADLNVANPAHTDGLNQADSHMRLLKATIKATFPNFTDVPLQSTQAQIDSVCLGTSALTFFDGTALLPGLSPAGDPDTGFWSPGPNQLAYSIGGVQQASFTPGAVVFVGGVAASAVVSVGAFSGGTGQLVPIGAVLEWYDDVLPPEGGYAWANGQIIANAATVCPVLLARWKARFGGDGITTMGVPDRRNTVAVGKATMGAVADRGLLANITTALITTLGSLFGLGTATITTPNLPPYTPSGVVAVQNGAINISHNANIEAFAGVTGGGSFSCPGGGAATITASQNASAAQFGGNAQGGSSTPMNNVQPSTTCNFIVRLG